MIGWYSLLGLDDRASAAPVRPRISPTGQITLLIHDDQASEDTFHDYAAITVPEPSRLLLSSAGLGFLAVLYRLRVRSWAGLC